VNRTTGESKWVDPRESLEFDLGQRQSVLLACLQAHHERHENRQLKVLATEPEAQIRSLPTAVRKRRQVPSRAPNEDQDSRCLTGGESSRSLPARISEIRFMPLQLPSPPTSHRFNPPGRIPPGDTISHSDLSSPPTPLSYDTAEPQPATDGKGFKVPSIMLNGAEVDQHPPPVPSILRRPPTTPCRWLAHARFVNSQVRSENDELQLLIAQLRKNSEKLKQLGSDSKERAAALAEYEALRAETAALRSRSKYCLARSTGVLRHPKSGSIASPKPPSTPRPKKFLTPR